MRVIADPSGHAGQLPLPDAQTPGRSDDPTDRLRQPRANAPANAGTSAPSPQASRPLPTGSTPRSRAEPAMPQIASVVPFAALPPGPSVPSVRGHSETG